MAIFTHFMIHATATPSDFDVTPEKIAQWHIQERGWSRVGYSVLVERDGKMDILIPWDSDDIIESWEISNGAAGWNGKTKHMAYAGGRTQDDGPEDNRTETQKKVLEAIVKLAIMYHPNIKLIGHNQVNSHKYCPSFDVRSWATSIGISNSNIDFNKYVENDFLA